jgi:hypothetical protein
MDPISIGALISGIGSIFGGSAVAGGAAFSGGMFSSLAGASTFASSIGPAAQGASALGALTSQVMGMFNTSASKANYAAGGLIERQAIAQQNDAIAKAAEYNASIALRNAEIAKFQGQIAEEDQARLATKTLGSARAAYGASGVTAASGSAIDVLAESAANAARDHYMIKYNTNLKVQSLNDQAALENMTAKNARASTTFGVLASRNREDAAYMKADAQLYSQAGQAATTVANSIPIYQSLYNRVAS